MLERTIYEIHGRQTNVQSIEVDTDADGHLTMVNIYCDDGTVDKISIVGLVHLMLGGSILHQSRRMYVNREIL